MDELATSTEVHQRAGARPTAPAIWHGSPDLDEANTMNAGCTIGHIGIELTELGTDHLSGQMPVDRCTRQPLGILHGGASVLLAETCISRCTVAVIESP